MRVVLRRVKAEGARLSFIRPKKGRNVREKECIYIRDDSQTIEYTLKGGNLGF